MKVPFFSFDGMHDTIKHEMLNAFEKVYDSKWYILGNNVKEFESAYASFSNTQYCAGISNCLDALVLSLQVLGIDSGDEVIVPSNTYIATVLAVTRLGATPVFAEPDKLTYNLDPENFEKAITSKTKAAIPVHLYGQPCNMPAITKVARRHNIFVVEDNAQSHAAKWNGQITGSWGDINATSFYPGKNLGALGDAGAITTNCEEWFERIKMLRNYGSSVKYYNEEPGYNMRLDELQAALLSVKLKYIYQWSEERVRVANKYIERLRGVKNVVLPYHPPECTHTYHLFIIRTDLRNQMQQYLREKGIDTLIHYPVPPFLQKAYRYLGYGEKDFPIAKNLADTMLSLPLYPGITDEQIEYVCKCIENFAKQHTGLQVFAESDKA
ncbi:DegT/DnrJ/EryC1/StrS family aminotransferase [Foetidibacter luteolus]|uniref:DegT/DnrJ/EryC1/StrS family aminotransferase n=1 Tax=Foetidibacter luteolus TaxID=2608880 RepID=UPI00129A8024|nr:DegT/DnrJ/EryC1/StrS family aminotransferase [Foetidibacter luteolus]